MSFGCLLCGSLRGLQFRPRFGLTGRTRHGEVRRKRSLAHRAGITWLLPLSRVRGRVGALDVLQRRVRRLHLVCGGAGTRGSGLDGRRPGLALVRLLRFSLSLSPGLSEAPGGVQTVASSREDLSGGDLKFGEPGRFSPRR
jgi:hypothetical protein